MQEKQLSFDFPCTHYFPEKKAFAETIILVPFFGGRKPSFSKHIKLLLDLGYEVVWLQLRKEPGFFNLDLRKNLVSSEGDLGMKHVWADQIEAVLNSISGKKIIFGFSTPSASGLEAIARRRGVDVAGIICDSGPSGQLLSSMFNYFQYEQKIGFLPLRALASVAMTLSWSPLFIDAIEKDLQKIPEGFRVLSIRGWKDKIITTKQIDKVFEKATHLQWQKLSLPNGGHCNGLRDFPEDYVPALKKFLLGISTSLHPRANLQK